MSGECDVCGQTGCVESKHCSFADHLTEQDARIAEIEAALAARDKQWQQAILAESYAWGAMPTSTAAFANGCRERVQREEQDNG